jgi:NADPH:quinone reductase-like Zn-dependent oxidoreductase
MRRRPPFVLGYDVVGEIDQLGDGVSGFQLGDRVADLTVLGSNAAYCTLRADRLTRVPAGVDAAEAAALILSWTTAYQLLHRARLRRHRRGRLSPLVHALKRRGLLCAYGYTASVQARRHLVTILMWIARVYLWRRLLPGGKRFRIYSINLMRALHPAWFREDLERLFGLLEAGNIRPRIAERISFDEVAEAHRRLEAGGLEGKLVLCPELPPRRDRVLP